MKKLYASLLTLGLVTPTHAETLNLTPYNTAEYTANTISAGKTNDDFLRVINANTAWARGYTGKGSTILIIDTGINATHKEFAGSILYTKSFVKGDTSITDKVGHGTGLAGIAAANWDGIGMAGVAPDANLAIAKVTNTTAYNFVEARNALVWGNQVGAVVANISANLNYDVNYNKNWVRLADGGYYNKDLRYVGRYFGNESPAEWARVLGTNMVLVNSAGNNGYAMPQQPGTLAKAVDANGNLVLGGQVLIVGSYDITTNNIASYSNRSGDVCFTVVNNNCADKYKISDFYIMAPGNAFTTDDVGNNYVIQTGTSQAAAVVSGAVAVINQQWPQMTAANIVKLLTATANKNVVGYNPTIHGQGLLDMSKATQPFGVVGIPTTGRTKVLLSGGFSTNTSGGLSALSSKLSSVMVTDEFNRDYYVDMSKAADSKRARADFNPITKAQFFESYNPYQKLNYYTFNGTVPNGDYDFKFAMNDYVGTAMFDAGKTTKFNDQFKYRVGFGMLNENNAWMGNSISGSFGEVNRSMTQFTNISGVYNLNKQVTVFGSAWMGITQANLSSSGLITNVGDTHSYSWNMGLDYTQNSHSFGATVSQPVTVYKGTVDVSLPSNITADGTVNFSRERVSIAPTVNEYDFGAYYKYRAVGTNFIAYGEHQVNYLNQSGVNNNVIGLALAKEW